MIMGCWLRWTGKVRWSGSAWGLIDQAGSERARCAHAARLNWCAIGGLPVLARARSGVDMAIRAAMVGDAGCGKERIAWWRGTRGGIWIGGGGLALGLTGASKQIDLAR